LVKDEEYKRCLTEMSRRKMINIKFSFQTYPSRPSRNGEIYPE